MLDSVDQPGFAEAQLRAQTQERLARELHDELTRRVASVSLQVMGHRGSDDVAQLRWALDTIAATTADILTYLGLLDRVLRAHPLDRSPVGSGSGLSRLVVCEPLVAVVDHQVQALREAGFSVDVVVPDPAHDVGPLARRTLEDAVTAARQTIARHAAPGSHCTLEVSTLPGSVSLRVTAPTPGWSGEVDDPTLVALHERVRLTEGAIRTGHLEHLAPPTWSLVLRLRDR